jgi:two-component system chemotaxis response regulator CheY
MVSFVPIFSNPPISKVYRPADIFFEREIGSGTHAVDSIRRFGLAAHGSSSFRGAIGMSVRTGLVIDDSSVMRKIVARSLEQAGPRFDEVEEAGNGAEALEIVKKASASPIPSDMNMPTEDGLEFVRQLKGLSSAHAIRIMMITAEAGEAHVMQALTSGASEYLRMTESAAHEKLIQARIEISAFVASPAP